jgi:hypothetical protein
VFHRVEDRGNGIKLGESLAKKKHSFRKPYFLGRSDIEPPAGHMIGWLLPQAFAILIGERREFPVLYVEALEGAITIGGRRGDDHEDICCLLAKSSLTIGATTGCHNMEHQVVLHRWQCQSPRCGELRTSVEDAAHPKQVQSFPSVSQHGAYHSNLAPAPASHPSIGKTRPPGCRRCAT